MDLDEPRIDKQRTRSVDGGIESLGLSDGSATPELAAVAPPVGLVQSSGHRLLDEHRNAGLQEWERDVAVALGRDRDRDSVHGPAKAGPHTGGVGGPHGNEVVRIEQRLRVHRTRNLFRAAAIGVDHGHELSPGERGEDPGMVSPEVTDADDRDAKAHGRPTIAMPASFAALIIASPSSIRVFAASTDKAVAPAARIASIVATPTTGTSNRMS
jgi:hypothetical protein